MNDSTMPLRQQRFAKKHFNGLVFSTFLSIGIILILLGVASTFASGVDASWPRIDGRIVTVQPKDENGAQAFAPVVSYQVDGRLYQTVADKGESISPEIGTLREIAYDPEIPLEAVVVYPSLFSILAVVLPAVGVLLILIGAVIYKRSRKQLTTAQIDQDKKPTLQ